MSALKSALIGVCATAGLAFAMAGGAMAQDAPAQDLANAANPALGALRLTETDGFGHSVHILPTLEYAAAARETVRAAGVLKYHAGGRIMPNIVIYPIFWAPLTLQNGQPAVLTAHYQSVLTQLATDYPANAIDKNNTQYYQNIGGLKTSIAAAGSLGGTYLDTAPYPASGCTDSATPGNCITDAQIQAEISRVISVNGWLPAINHMFLMFTAQGEGSCFTSASTSCAYTAYCAYHGSFGGASTPVIYGNEPYGDLANCQVSGAPSPNADPEADAAGNVATHEVTEAITDPLLNAWFSNTGSEIGDLCSFTYGAHTLDGGKANQDWNTHFYLVQEEYDNKKSRCVQAGP